jgi:hydrogenase/urease accessory protein HupE
MRRWRWLLVVLLLGFAAPAQAHRLDEYLQQTIVSIDQRQVVLKLYLTAGVNVAPAVLAQIDTDRDGVFSPAEQQAYADRVRQDLTLRLDTRPLVLGPSSSSFPAVSAVSGGLADIRMTMTADLPGSAGTHQLVLTNRHQNWIAVYLVNALAPSDPQINILSQTRNVDQSVYTLKFSSGGARAGSTDDLSASSLAASGRRAVVTTYIWRGVRHILTGYDHLLFVAALVLAAASLWDLVKVVTAFTVAHTLTLALATFGLVHLPAQIVEPVIAASIVFVAAQNIWWPGASRGGSRLAVAFLFGLMHGLGFASGLLELMHQMPLATALLALLGFSLGIELGNQVVLLPLFGILQLVRRIPDGPEVQDRLAGKIRQLGSGAVGAAGAYYFWVALHAALN